MVVKDFEIYFSGDENTENSVKEDEIFLVEEINIEELAIDGICGVY